MKRHPLDSVSLVFGALFAAMGILHLAGGLDSSVLRFRWLAAVALIVVGAVLLLGGRGGDTDESDAGEADAA